MPASDDSPISDEPRIGGLYQHFKGGFYVVLGKAIETETGDQIVIYLGIADSKYYTRKVSRWFAPSPSAPDLKRYQRVNPVNMALALQNT